MKIILVIALLCSIVFAGLVPSSNRKGRGVAADPNQMDIDFLGTCQEFSAISGSISVSQLTLSTVTWLGTNPAPTQFNCLPIDATVNVQPLPDYNNLRAEYLCNQVGKSRSIIRIVEIVDPSLATNHPDYTPLDFILGFRSSKPFRASGANYMRRPSCEVTLDYCHQTDPTLAIVSSCNTTSVTVSNGWVMNKDLVYIIPTSTSTLVGDCKPPSSNACCDYIKFSQNVAALPFGICPFSPSNELFEAPHESYHNNNEHGQENGQEQEQEEEEFEDK